MIRILLLATLAILVHAQLRCESPPQWTSTNFYFSPIQGHINYVEAHYTYDKTNQRKSWRERIPEGETNSTYEYVHRIELGIERKEYLINVRTGECTVRPLRFQFYAHDVPADATFRRLFYLGTSAFEKASVELSDWDVRFTTSFWEGTFTTQGCIPYHSNHYNSTTFGMRFESIVDVTPGIDPNEFVVPPGCQ